MKQNPFLQKKATILKAIENNSPDSLDASPKGTIDVLCMPIINLINSSDRMVTTSTCSGRVSVFLEGLKIKAVHKDGTSESILENGAPDADINEEEVNVENRVNVKPGGKGDGGKWLFITHDVNELDGWYKNTFFSESGDPDIEYQYIEDSAKITQAGNVPTTRYLLFKFEPLILHVLCANREAAGELYTTAMACGFRESGIGKNNNVAIRISIRLDIPIGFLEENTDSNKQKVNIFTQDYVLELITNMSKDKFHQNEKKLSDLYNSIESLILPTKTKGESDEAGTSSSHEETKEERRQRKIAEGMARRDEVRKLKELKKLEKLRLVEQETSNKS